MSTEADQSPDPTPVKEDRVSEAAMPYLVPEALRDTEVRPDFDSTKKVRTRTSGSQLSQSSSGSSATPPVCLDGAAHTRRDLLTGDWTIFAPEREKRPNEFEAGSELADEVRTVEPMADSTCPFCAGAEAQTPEAVWSARLVSEDACTNDPTRLPKSTISTKTGEQAGWDVRVVPNKFPVVDQEPASDSEARVTGGMFPAAGLIGGHEVIIESSRHIEKITEVDPSLVFMTLLAYRERILHWRDVPGVQYISVFKNCGPSAGASLRHSHSQLIATSLVPHRIRATLLRSESHRARTGCSLGCDLLRAELEAGERIVTQVDSFVAFCPFASRFPGLIRITSSAHEPYFEQLGNDSLDRLASLLRRVVHWVQGAYPGKAYNLILNTCPPGANRSDPYQWSLDIFPRLTKIAGFECGSDCMINQTLPETAAQVYREVAAVDDPRRILAIR